MPRPPRLLTFAAVVALLAACSTEKPAGTGTTTPPAASDGGPAAPRPLKIGVTLHPYYSWVKNIVGDLPGIEVVPVLPGEIDAGNYQPAPADLRKLADLDAIVINGYAHDDFINDMIKAAANPRLVVIKANDETPMLRSLRGDAPNSHTFISFTNAAQQTHYIERRLSELRPEYAETFHRNAAAYADRIRAMQAATAQKLVGAKVKRVVTVHDGYSYLLQEFGLEAAAVVEPTHSHGLVPSVAELTDTIALMKKEQLTVILSEVTFPEKLLELVRGETGARVFIISHVAMGTYSADEFEKVMQQNADTLVEALAAGGK
jgi:zinc transport system substrate-binding protein